jgi:hypothetical protein
MNNELFKMIEFYNNYVKGKQFTDNKLQNILTDCLNRYMHLWEFINKKGNIKLLECIKQYNKINNCPNIQKTVHDTLILPTVNETNKLLLIKCIYYCVIYEINFSSDQQQDHYDIHPIQH